MFSSDKREDFPRFQNKTYKRQRDDRNIEQPQYPRKEIRREDSNNYSKFRERDDDDEERN